MTELQPVPKQPASAAIPDSYTEPIHAHPGRPWLWEELLTSGPLVLVDVLALAASLFASEFACAALGAQSPHLLAIGPAIAATTVLIFFASSLYPATAVNAVVELRRMVIGVTIAFGSCVAFAYGTVPSQISTVPLLLSFAGAAIAIPISRTVARRLLRRTSWWGRSVLLLGHADQLEEVMAMRESLRHQGMRPFPVASDLGDSTWASLAAQKPRWIVICSAQPWESILANPLAGHFRQISVIVPSMMRVLGQSWIEPAQVGPTAALQVRNRLLFTRYAIAKRCLDLTICMLALPPLLPVLLVLALAVRLSSPGPIFFSHRRLGRDGQWISIWKFRTMVTDAAKRLEEHLAAHPELAAEWEATHKLRQDPRVTGIGRFLRHTSLDELPQLWTVLTGKMSLVGPRPIVADEIQKYGETYALYKRVTPGITGLWQVSGRNDTSYPERVELDAAYVRNWSLWLDLYILFRTVKTVLRREGAC